MGVITKIIKAFRLKRAAGIFIFTVLSCLFTQRLEAFDLSVKKETITYDIKKFKITIGEARLAYNGLVNMNGQKALSVTFRAQGFKFLDKEQIFLDPNTFHPLLIRRDLDIFGVAEQITEYYDSKKGKVRIVKMEKGKATEQVIENGSRFDNIYGFIYRSRFAGKFREGVVQDLHLPTADVQLVMKKKTKIKTNGKEYNAYYFGSIPRKYKVWFESGKAKLPLKIVGALGIANMSMVMTDHLEER